MLVPGGHKGGMEQIEAIAAVIRKQQALGYEAGEAEATWLRCAALFVHMDFPAATSSDFAAAAATVTLLTPNRDRTHLIAQAARNRWNESKKFWEAEGEW